MTPQQFGPYELHELLGVGGMGEVYRAWDSQHERWVALKLLPEVFAHDEEYLHRFRRESHVAARLREPHVIPIHAYGEIDGRLFIDMRMVDGEDLHSILGRDGALSPARAVNVVGQIADALDAAHSESLVHRDIKPSNVLVTPRDFVYVVDFGIARAVGMTQTALTITGATVGTLDYMAPERFTARPIDGRADVYSLACVLAESLTAQRPFPGEDLPSLMYAHLYTEPPRLSTLGLGIPPALDDVVARGMAKRPEDRYATAGELATAARDAVATPAPATRDLAPAAPAAPETVREPAPGLPAPFPPGLGRGPAESGPSRPTVSAPPLAVREAGLASADGGHRSVDPLPPPRAPGDRAPAPVAVAGPAGPGGPGDTGPGGPGGAGPEGLAPPAPGRGPRTALRIALVAVAAAVVAGLVVGGLYLWGPGSTGPVTAGSRGTASTGGSGAIGRTGAPASPSVTPAESLATPLAGPAIPVGKQPQYLQLAPNGRFGYIADPGANDVIVFDTTLDKVTATIPIPQGPPQFITFAPDGRRAYVTIYNADYTQNFVAFLDTRTNTVVKTITVGKRPFAPATTPDGKLLYVPLHNEGRVDVINTSTGSVVAHIPVPPNPHWIAITRDARTGYTADHESNVVSVLNLQTNTVVKTIPVGTSPHSIAISPDGTRLAVVCFTSNDLYLIDTRTNTVVGHVPDVGSKPQDVVWAPDGKHLYTANVNDGTVAVVDAATGAITARIPTGAGPTSIAVLPNGKQAFVTNFDDGTLRILDTAGD